MKGLWRLMFRRYTDVHRLDNLIWVWNSPVPACYPGDDTVDIPSRDLYPPPHAHGAHVDKLRELQAVTPAHKLALIGETGTLPSAEALAEARAEWVSYMTWCGGYCLTEDFTAPEVLRATYGHPWAVTKDRLPALY